MKKYGSYSLIKSLLFERIGGSKEELKAAKIIQEELKKDGIESHLEEFEVDSFEIMEAKLEVLEPKYKEYTVTGIGRSGSTPDEGIEAELVYVENGHDVNLENVEGKIVLVNAFYPLKLYKKLVEKKVVGIIALNGSVYDDPKKTDLHILAYRDKMVEAGRIPGVTLRIKDAHELVKSKASKARLTLKQEEMKKTSHNVVAEIKGTEYPERIVAFSAHYDSVRFSEGAYDNATGSATILEIARHFKKNPPKRTLKFVWCGSEEMGLLGSKAYVEKHQEELAKYELNINLDMTAVVLGYDIARCTTEMGLVNYINYLGKEVGFAIDASQGVYSSDSTPFADKGVPALSFARIAPRGGAEIHSRKDDDKFLDKDNYYETCKFIIGFSERMANSVIMPVERSIPENMRLELDYYLGIKERPEGPRRGF